MENQKRGWLEKFRTEQAVFDGKQHTYPRSLESRRLIVGGIWLLVYIALFGTSVYLELPGAVRAFIVIGIGTVMSIITIGVVSILLAPDIKDLKSDDEPAFGSGKDRVQEYILLVLLTNATVTTIATFLFMLFVKHGKSDLSE